MNYTFKIEADARWKNDTEALATKLGQIAEEVLGVEPRLAQAVPGKRGGVVVLWIDRETATDRHAIVFRDALAERVEGNANLYDERSGRITQYRVAVVADGKIVGFRQGRSDV